MKRSAKRQSISPVDIDNASSVNLLVKTESSKEPQQERKKQKVDDKAGAMQRAFTEMLSKLKDLKDDGDRQIAELFLVLPSKKLYPDYYIVIALPISFAEIEKKIAAGQYENVDQFKDDVNLMFANACTYNQEGSFVYEDAKLLQKTFDDLISKYKAASTVKAIKIKPPKDDSALLVEAIVRNDFKLFQELITKPSFNVKQMMDSQLFNEPCEWNWIHFAAYHGRYRMISMLVECGADVESKDSLYKGSSLGWAAFNNQLRAARVLVEDFGADIHSKNVNGSNPFDLLPAEALEELQWLEILAEPAQLEIPQDMPSQYEQRSLKAMKLIYAYLISMTDETGRRISDVFITLPSRKEYAQYYAQIKRPIAFDLIAKKLSLDLYAEFEQFETDVNLVFQNAKTFNPPEHFIYKDAKFLQQRFESACKATREKKLGEFLKFGAKIAKEPLARHLTKPLETVGSMESIASDFSNAENIDVISNVDQTKSRRKSVSVTSRMPIFNGDQTQAGFVAPRPSDVHLMRPQTLVMPPSQQQQGSKYIRAEHDSRKERKILADLEMVDNETGSTQFDWHQSSKACTNICVTVPDNVQKLNVKAALSSDGRFHTRSLLSALFNKKPLNNNNSNPLVEPVAEPTVEQQHPHHQSSLYEYAIELEHGMNVLEMQCTANTDAPHYLAKWNADSNQMERASETEVMRPIDLVQTYRLVIVRL